MTVSPADQHRGKDLSEVVAAAVLSVTGVSALHGGTFGEVATYLPGRAITGVRVREDVTEIHVILDWGAPVLGTAEAIRARVQELVNTRVDVSVDDVIDPAPTRESRTAAAPGVRTT